MPDSSDTELTLHSQTPPTYPVLSLVGEYRIIRRLGEGAFGVVYMAEAPGGTDVALKVIKQPLDARESQEELKALEYVKKLNHPYLVQTHAIFFRENQLHIVMELAEKSLKDRALECKKQGLVGVPVDELLRYFREAAEALDYFHVRQIHHRDIKPANMLLLAGHVKLADFGLARLLPADQSMVEASKLGTPLYAPPEVWEGKISDHSDQWSLAVAYAELRLGRPLFKGDAPWTLMSEIMLGQFDFSPLPEAEQAVLRKAMARVPGQRYPTCVEFVAALQEAARPTPAESYPPARSSDTLTLPPEPVRGRGWLALTCLGLALGGLFGLLAFLLLRPAPRLGVEPPPPVQVATGHEASFPLHLHREQCQGRVRVDYADGDVPDRVMLEVQEADGNPDELTVVVRAAVGAAPGTHRIRLRADCDGLEAETTFELTVLFLPKDFVPDGEVVADLRGVRYYRQIATMLAGRRVPFVFVPRRKSPGVTAGSEPFYIMQDKVSLGLFRRFASIQPALVQGKEWQEGKDDRFPVLGVTVDDAYHFAQWMRGNLPTVEQWDRAAGRYESTPREGPYNGTWTGDSKLNIAVNRPLPAPIGSSSDDMSPFGCHDMAGNGYEWTRTLMFGRGIVPVANPQPAEHIVCLRGRSFNEPTPLRFDDLDERKSVLPVLPYTNTLPDLGFRVVIEPAWGERP